jgi:phosphate transport system substrate-binding protein
LGAGASFPYPVYTKWAEAHKKAGGAGLIYQAVGSGGGIKQIKTRTATFGATDAPLSGKDLEENGLVQFPMLVGGIVPIVNIEGISAGGLALDGPTLATIFLGEIKSWDDERILQMNPGARLPHQLIAVVRRSDGSGTTFNFTYYLSQVSSAWQLKVGANTTVEWPVGVGARGNEGVSNVVTQTKGTIGYAEYAYAKQNELAYTKMINRDGRVVAPASSSFRAAAASADWKSRPGYDVVLANQPGPESWPITATTWVLLDKRPQDLAAAASALKFFAWAFAN